MCEREREWVKYLCGIYPIYFRTICVASCTVQWCRSNIFPRYGSIPGWGPNGKQSNAGCSYWNTWIQHGTQVYGKYSAVQCAVTCMLFSFRDFCSRLTQFILSYFIWMFDRGLAFSLDFFSLFHSFSLDLCILNVISTSLWTSAVYGQHWHSCIHALPSLVLSPISPPPPSIRANIWSCTPMIKGTTPDPCLGFSGEHSVPSMGI